MLQTDGNLLCGDCIKYEQAWQEEDLGYEEYDENDEVARAHTSGEKKRAARTRNKSAKTKTKSEKIIDSPVMKKRRSVSLSFVIKFRLTPNKSEGELEDPESSETFANIENNGMLRTRMITMIS